MQKQTKLIIGGVGVLALVVLLSIRAKAGSNTNPNINPSSTEGTLPTSGNTGSGCPTGEIPCPANPSKCYNPSIDYFVNPCN
jgi:hypothetical protein